MRYKYGMIHGRFQPFHLEHLRYFRVAWERSDNVLVGITNPDPSTIIADELNQHRHLPEENPFSFTERLMMIQQTLREAGYPMERVFLVPLPIHHPDRWRYYVPPGTAMFVVVYSPWEQKKAERLRQAGLEVIVVDSLQKGISGQELRSLLASGGDWESLVPAAVARFLHRKLGDEL
jgi:nicotinamide mononucleotide adenylyltransferase